VDECASFVLVGYPLTSSSLILPSKPTNQPTKAKSTIFQDIVAQCTVGLVQFELALTVIRHCPPLAWSALAPHNPSLPSLLLHLTHSTIMAIALSGAAAASDATARLASLLVHRSAGARRRSHHSPMLRSQSLAQFWGVRWNRLFGGSIADAVLGPDVSATGGKRRRSTGRSFFALAAVFFASGIMHVVPLLPTGANASALADCMAFFLLQIPLLVLDQGVARPLLPRPLRRALSIVLLSLSFLLFLAPMHELYGDEFYADTLFGRTVCASGLLQHAPTWLFRC